MTKKELETMSKRFPLARVEAIWTPVSIIFANNWNPWLYLNHVFLKNFQKIANRSPMMNNGELFYYLER